MDDEAIGINNGKSVIHVLTCMIMIRSYIPGFSRCTSCWCTRNRMGGSTQRIQWHSPMLSGRVIFTFCQISDLLRRFYTFSKFSLIFKWPKKRGNLDQWVTFSSITMCKSRFFPTKKKKNWFWALRRVSVAIVTWNLISKMTVYMPKLLWGQRQNPNESEGLSPLVDSGLWTVSYSGAT